MWGELGERLERCEARMRDQRRLLQEQRPSAGDAMPPSMLNAVAVLLQSVSEADAAGEAFCAALRRSGDSGPRRLDPPGDGGSAGNAPVGAGPRLPIAPDDAGAARTFEEAFAPPRNP